MLSGLSMTAMAGELESAEPAEEEELLEIDEVEAVFDGEPHLNDEFTIVNWSSPSGNVDYKLTLCGKDGNPISGAGVKSGSYRLSNMGDYYNVSVPTSWTDELPAGMYCVNVSITAQAIGGATFALNTNCVEYKRVSTKVPAPTNLKFKGAGISWTNSTDSCAANTQAEIEIVGYYKNGAEKSWIKYGSRKVTLVANNLLDYKASSKITDADNYAFRLRTLSNDLRKKADSDWTPWCYLDPNGEKPSKFTDVVPGAFYEQAVNWAVEKGVTTGTSPTTFSPDKECTRGQVVAFLWRAYGSPEPTLKTSPFKDVQDKGRYFYKAVLWAVENGVTTGTSPDKFSPDDTVTRGQFVTFLYRAEGKPGVSGGCKFTDVPSGKFYYNPVIWAANEGVTTGTSPTEFSPEKACTRAQVVTFIYRALKDK